MKKILLLLSAMLFVTSCSSEKPAFEDTDVQAPPSVSEEFAKDRLADAENTELPFAYRLNALMPHDRNYIFSPLSLKMSLDLVANGAENTTREELLKVADINNIDDFNNYERQLVTTYVNNGDILLKIANSLWLNENKLKKHTFGESYKQIIGDLHSAKLGSVTEKDAQTTINTWCSQNTNGRISDITSGGDFRSYLVNALYFSGVWTNPFTDTEDGFFTDRNGMVDQIKFMSATNNYNFYEDSEVKILELPYGLPKEIKDNSKNTPDSVDIAMYIIINGDRRMDFSPYLDILSRENVHVLLPEFVVEYGADFSKELNELGITSAFRKDADFGTMFGTNVKFNLENTIHKAVLKINENGAEQFEPSAYKPKAPDIGEEEEIKEFAADEPFTFIIMDKRMNEILFLGEYAYTDNNEEVKK